MRWENSWNAGGQIDYETRRIYGAFRSDFHYSSLYWHRMDTLQLGFAPPKNGTAHAGQAYWSEVLTDDLDTTTSFFADVFGWQRSSIDLGDGKYTVFLDGSTQRAGAIANPTVAPQWLTYFLVDQIEAAFAKAQALGAVVVQPVNPIPGLGRAAVLKDLTDWILARA